MAQHGLRLTQSTGTPGKRRDLRSQSDQNALHATSAKRLLEHLARFKKSHNLSRPITLLDASGGKPDLLRQIDQAASDRSIDIELTVLAESETTTELLSDAQFGFAATTIESDTLDTYVQRAGAGGFDCVHAALCLTQLREIPMLTRLGKLERFSSPLFVWSDLPRGAKRKHYRDIIKRVDLGFCEYKKPLRSALFTIAGERKPLAPVIRSEPGADR